MAGHSKWANIKHRKAAVDAKRGAVFTKLAKELTVAAKLGGSDENSNPRLRTAILKARAANMPKDNIERAIKKGAGELAGVSYEEGVYEGYGPGGIAVMVEVMTDKKSRTIPELRSIFTKFGGNMAEAGAVGYLFDYKGVIVLEADNTSEELLFDKALEAGAEDIEQDGDNIFVVKTAKENFNAVLTALVPLAEEQHWKIIESGLKYIPQATTEVDPEKAQAVMKLLEALENHDDVQNVYSNLEMNEELFAAS